MDKINNPQIPDSLPPIEVLSMVSRELQHPINAIIGWIDILSKPDMQDKRDEAVEWIAKWATAINTTLSEVQKYIEKQEHDGG